MGDRITEPFEPYESESSYDWDYEDERTGQPKILWGRVVALGAVLLLAFFLGRATAPEGIPQEDLKALQDTNAELEQEISDLTDQLAAQPSLPTASPTPTDTQSPSGGVLQKYVVKPGDNLVKISEQLYGDGSLWECIAAQNGIGQNESLRAGEELLIPPESECT